MSEFLNLIKKELIKVNRKLEFNNIEQSFNKLDNYFELLIDYKELKLDKVFKEETKEDFYEIYDPKNNLFVGRTKLLLGGGVIGSFEIFIPESLIRQEKIEEGDWIKVSAQSRYFYQGAERYIYDYEKIKKDPVTNSNRKVLKRKEVFWDEFLQEYYIEDKDSQDLELKILLNDQKLYNIEVEKGDFVDYAYYEGEILEGKVIWCFNK